MSGMTKHHAKFATVECVREQGCQVNVFHLRRYWVIDDKGRPAIDYFPACVKDIDKALPTGGMTFVRVILPNGKELIGSAECADTDHYNRQRGVRIALNRALVHGDWLNDA